MKVRFNSNHDGIIFGWLLSLDGGRKDWRWTKMIKISLLAIQVVPMVYLPYYPQSKDQGEWLITNGLIHLVVVHCCVGYLETFVHIVELFWCIEDANEDIHCRTKLLALVWVH